MLHEVSKYEYEYEYVTLPDSFQFILFPGKEEEGEKKKKSRVAIGLYHQGHI